MGPAKVPVGGGGARPRCWSAAAGPGRASRRGESSSAQQAPPVWRPPAGPENLAAVPVGGGRARARLEATRRAKLAARTASGRAAAHGRTKQPGPRDRPRGARNTSGTTSNKTGRQGRQRDLPWRRRVRRTWLRCPWAVAGPGRASRRHKHRRCGGRRRVRRTWLRCPWAVAGPGRGAGRRWQGQGGPRTRRIVLSTTGPTGVEGAGGTGGPGCGARGRRQGLAGLRDDAPSRRLAARTASGRAAAHGHTEQPSSNTRKPRPADAGRGSPTQSGGRV